ncbi:MAG TPA: IS66 family transposase [Nitrospiraceae bacterium]|nr:IS66 family transposase [Nitrospiraceae bacterium]
MPYDELQAALAIAELQRENRELRGQLRTALETVHRLTQENQQLKLRLQELERVAARQAAPFRRRPQKKVDPAHQQRPGQKPGHPGTCRQVPEHVDEDLEVPLLCCPRCGGQVENRAPLLQYIEEIPALQPHVTRLVTWSGTCATCGPVRTTHPLQTSVGQGAAKVQLGPRALALAALLNKQLGLPMRKTCAVLKQLGGLSVTPGGLSQLLSRVAGKVTAEYGQLRERVQASAAVFVDETSWWVGGPGWWLWVFTTPQGDTLFRVDQRRGSPVVHEILGADFAGVLVSDCLSAYDPCPYRKHKCLGHHLQAIRQARDRPDNPEPAYLEEWKQLFQQVLQLYDERDRHSAAEFARQKSQFAAWSEKLLQHPCTQPGDVAVQNRLLKQRAHLLTCLDDTAAEPTNNRAERALRPAVIARKVSCGNKTAAGCHCWQILVSLAATCQAQAGDFVDFLAARLPLAIPAG